MVEAERPRGGEAVERVGGPGQRGGSQGARVSGIAGGGETIVVAGEHLHVGEHMVREQHRLGVLQVRVARQDDIEVRLGLGNERLAQGNVGGHKLAGTALGVQARVGCHLVVARAARVQPRPGIPHAAGQLRLDGHVDVLAFHHVERERAGGDVGQNALEPFCNGFGIGGRDDALGGQHVSMGDRAGDVLGVESLIHGQRCPEALGEGIGAFSESSRPQCHSVSSVNR